LLLLKSHYISYVTPSSRYARRGALFF